MRFNFTFWFWFAVHIPVLVTRENRRQTYDLVLQIANRRLNPTLSFVSWNIHVTQLECARNTPAVVSGRISNDSFMPLNPYMARTIANDVEHLGTFYIHFTFLKFYTNLIRFSCFACSTTWMFAIPFWNGGNNRIVQFQRWRWTISTQYELCNLYTQTSWQHENRVKYLHLSLTVFDAIKTRTI